MALSPERSDTSTGTVEAERAERTQVRVSAGGVLVLPAVDAAIDVFVGDSRIWSLNPSRDADTDGWTRWPQALVGRLDGVLSWSVRRHADGQVLASGRLALGRSDRAIALVDDAGRALAIDKAGRLSRIFEQSDAQERGLLVDTVVRALEDLRGPGGAEAFLAFGCLLGAVRDGRMIGHDKDADVAVLCPSPYPVDVARQSFRLERLMESRGWRTRRMSGGNFKVYIDLPDGSAVGIDTFSGWHDLDGRFHLMPNVRATLPVQSLLPVGSVVLEGRDVVAPRDPVPLLAATYGPGWSVPDPAFCYDTPAPTVQRLTGWFRGMRHGLDHWEACHAAPDQHPLALGPSDFAAWVLPRLTAGAHLVDVGCGTGRDTFWFADRGRSAEGLDYDRVGLAVAREEAGRRRADAGPVPSFGHVNVVDLRSLLRLGARLAALTRPVDVYARLLADSIDAGARADLWRLLDMAGRSGGRSFVEVRLDPRRSRMGITAQSVRPELEHRGARVVEQVEGPGQDDPAVLRVVAEWRRS